MKKKIIRIREDSLLARLAARKLGAANVAMVIGKTIHLHGVSAADFRKNASWVAHELQHVRQYERYGTIGFLFRYFYYSLRKGYYRNPLEAEARAAEKDLSFLEQYDLEFPAQKTFANESLNAIFAPQSSIPVMSHLRKVPPTGAQKRVFFIHLVIYIVAVIAMFVYHGMQEKAAGTWVYPWHAWPVAAWSLAIIGHWCALWTTYEDKGLDDFNRMVQNG